MPFWKRFPPARVAGLIVAITCAALPGRAGDDERFAPELRPGSRRLAGEAPPGLGPGQEHGLVKLDGWGDPGGDEHAAARGLAARQLLEKLEEQINTGKWIPFRRPRSRGERILATFEESSPEPANGRGPDPFLDRFRFNLSRGLEYGQRIPLSRQGLKLKLYGPIVSGAPGLGLQLKGRLAARDFKLKALGSTDEASLGLEIEF